MFGDVLLSVLTITTLRGKITTPFYFCSNFVKPFHIKIIIGTHTLRNLEQNDIRIIGFVLKDSFKMP